LAIPQPAGSPPSGRRRNTRPIPRSLPSAWIAACPDRTSRVRTWSPSRPCLHPQAPRRHPRRAQWKGRLPEVPHSIPGGQRKLWRLGSARIPVHSRRWHPSIADTIQEGVNCGSQARRHRPGSEGQPDAQSWCREHDKTVEHDGQEAAESESGPEPDIPAQERRDEQEHWQGR